MEYEPSPAVSALIAVPEFGVRMTVAPATIPPDSSVTTPFRVAVWLYDVEAKEKKIAM
jgi:hypothetical protein